MRPEGEHTELYGVQSSDFTAQSLHDKGSHGVTDISLEKREDIF